MPLFQKSVLNKYLKEQDKETVLNVYQTFKRYFHNPQIQQNIRDSKEEQFQEGYLRELFVKVFGYTLNPDPDFNLTTEFKNQTGAQKADGAILKNNKAVGVIELKSTKTKDLETVRKQAFDYKANQPGCNYVITSNFQKLRFYINDAVEFEEFDLFILSQVRFEVLYLCLSCENILADLPLKIKNASILEEEQITRKFYADYSLFKKDLFESMVKLNMGIEGVSKLQLYKKTQKLLDRFLFIFFAEDRNLLPPNSISRMIKRWNLLKDEDAYKPLYEIYKQYFGYLNKGRKGKVPADDIHEYNGGLFLPDELLDRIEIDDEVLLKHTSALTNYDFESQVGVNILGHIFEHSLNEIESTTAELEGIDFDKQKSKRKKDGVFYTPKYITKYIVDNTVGKLCVEKKTELGIRDDEFTPSRQKETKKRLLTNLEKYRTWLLELTICDPACGSGAFLNQALEFLISEHHYIDDLNAKLFGSTMVFQDVENQILENNIFGVDINEESVDIARLSLWLRTAQRGRKLTTLNKNIKCGNSLIDDPEVAGDKAFNWNKEFPEVFAKGGFDVVIGNPPYVDIKGLEKEIVKHIFKRFKSANNRVNLYSSFIEKSVELLYKTGYFSFIIPSSLLTQDSYKELRRLLLDETTIKSIIRLPNESFGGSAGDVKVDTIILTLKAGIYTNDKAEIIVYKGFDRITEISNYNSDLYFAVNPFIWKNDANLLFRINADNSTIKILNKCQNEIKKLIDCAEFCLGLTPYDKYKGHSQEQIKNRVFHSDHKRDSSYRRLLAGNDIKRYNVHWGGKEWISYGSWLGAPREIKFFTDKRILIKQIIDWTDKRIWAAITDDELFNTQNAFNLIPKKEFHPEYLVALINSKLMSFYHRKQFLEEFKDRFQKILIKDAKEFPVKVISIEEQRIYIEKVRQLTILVSHKSELAEKFIKFFSSRLSINELSRNLLNWHKLKFGEFIKELNKSIKKAGGEKLSKMDEMEWMEVFETKKAEAQSLKAEIDKTDKEIDLMVYELYGLTEEEIGIVEGR